MKTLQKILVTGGAGFIGSHLVDALLKKRYFVRVLDNLFPQIHPSKKLPSYFNKQAQFIKGDVTQKKDWQKALTDIDAVFHLAAAVGVGQSMYEIEHYVKVNSFGTAVLLDILANNTKHKVKKIVVAASMSSYGEGAYFCSKCGVVQPPLRSEKLLRKKDFNVYCPKCRSKINPIATKEETRQNSNSIYAITKKNQEEMVLNFGQTYHIPVTALRYFNVYGARQSLSNPYNGVVAIFLSRIKNNKSPIINEDGLQTRDFIHIKDVTRANIAALENKKADYQVYNVGSGKPITIKKVAETLIKICRKKINPDISYKFRKLDVRHCFADISKINKDLNWYPQVDFEKGIKDVIAWSEKEKSIDKLDFALKQLEKRGLR